MKGCKHQTNTYESTLEQIEQMIESIDSEKPIRIGDITGKFKNPGRDIRQATSVLLKKYGITYQE